MVGDGGRTAAQGFGVSDGLRQKFTQKERDIETGLDYFLARYYSSAQGRFFSADDPKYALPTDPQTWNLYLYVRNGPLNKIDPDGHNWYEFEGAWYWYKGSGPRSFKDKDAKEHVVKKSYTHLVRFTKTGTNDRVTATGNLEIYEQDKQIVSSEAFSGGTDKDGKQLNIIPDGTYYIGLQLDHAGAEDASMQFGLKPNFGIQTIPPGTLPGPYETTIEPSYEWGSIRARLNYPGEANAPEAYQGNYIHGKRRTEGGDYTHSCVCERSERVLNVLLGLARSKVPQAKIPTWVRTLGVPPPRR